MNTFLDGWFVLQTLLAEYYEKAGHGPASNLTITKLPPDISVVADANEIGGTLPEEWQKAFKAEQNCRMVVPVWHWHLRWDNGQFGRLAVTNSIRI